MDSINDRQVPVIGPLKQGTAKPAPTSQAAPAAPSPAGPPDSYTPLQKHIAFFDKNRNGKLTLGETSEGLGKLGVPLGLQTLTAAVINGGLGFHTTADHKPTFNVEIANIKAAKHPGDTGIFDQAGKFNAGRFEEIFAKYDTNQSGSLSWKELEVMIADNAKRDASGKFPGTAEFKLLMFLAADGKADENGKEVPTISRERLQQFYDGTLFYKIAAQREAAK